MAGIIFFVVDTGEPMILPEYGRETTAEVGGHCRRLSSNLNADIL